MDTLLQFLAMDSYDTSLLMVSVEYANASRGSLGGVTRERRYNVYKGRCTGRNGYLCRVTTKRDMAVMSMVMVTIVQGRA